MTTTLSVLLFSACNDENESASSLAEALDIETEATTEANYKDVDDIVDAGIDAIGAVGGRVERDIILNDCADVQIDTVAKVVTVDYGEGCTGPFGRVRKGKIIIEYNDRRFIPGAFRIATLENFYVDNVKVEGVRTLTNISETTEDSPTFAIGLDGGKLTFEDGTTATREVDHIRTWTRAANPLNDTVNVAGTANGKRRDDIDYAVEILEPIVYRRDCRLQRVFVPVSGVKEITFGDSVALVDYGDGTCDNEVTITIDGVSETRNLRMRGRGI